MRIVRWTVALLITAWFGTLMYINVVTDSRPCEARYWMVGAQPKLQPCSENLMALNDLAWIALCLAVALVASVYFINRVTRRTANG